MISRLVGAVFTPKYPKGYVGRHRVGAVAARIATTPRPAVLAMIGPGAT